MFLEVLTEIDQIQKRPRESQNKFERQLLSSKLKSLNQQIQNLMQKRIRIDLEIKRTKQKISKLKSQSETYLKTKVELEGFSEETFAPCDVPKLEKAIGSEEYEGLLELCSQIVTAEECLTEANDLPLVETN